MASSEANKALEQVWETLENAIQHSIERNEELDCCSSLYSFFQEYCDQKFHRGEISQREIELVLGMSEMWGAYVGDRVERQSLKFFYLEDCIAGGKQRKQPPIACD